MLNTLLLRALDDAFTFSILTATACVCPVLYLQVSSVLHVRKAAASTVLISFSHHSWHDVGRPQQPGRNIRGTTSRRREADVQSVSQFVAGSVELRCRMGGVREQESEVKM